MAVIDIGLNFEEAQKVVKDFTTPVPPDTYELQVVNVDVGTTRTGRTRLRWTLQIINHPEYAGRWVSYFTNVPTPTDTTGVGFLIQITKALGKPWTGKTLVTDEYIGLTCRANVGLSRDDRWNEIISFVP